MVIVHGSDYSHQGQYTGVLERSELNPTYPATATVPALCGTLTASRKTTASSGRGAVYTAKLVDNPYAAFLCEASEGFALAAERRRDAARSRAPNGLA